MARAADLRRLLLRFHLYRFDPAAAFDAAARICRGCRQCGLDRVAGIIGIDLDWPDA